MQRLALGRYGYGLPGRSEQSQDDDLYIVVGLTSSHNKPRQAEFWPAIKRPTLYEAHRRFKA